MGGLREDNSYPPWPWPVATKSYSEVPRITPEQRARQLATTTKRERRDEALKQGFDCCHTTVLAVGPDLEAPDPVEVNAPISTTQSQWDALRDENR